ncbi:lipid transfer protein EARLI 1-like [Salvia miltiorrhiza]|uniref:lipid transfer protein EARLI 1-like n=1 Tax=Salvia miltiorrhiza TaxID=226208 RepID=UPI0025AB9C41|nr:lipid transfer protein EARLI 1-like [Salvia miltiorrhiza]
MAKPNSSRRVILGACLVLVSLALANSSATCPADVVLRLDSCSHFASWIVGGGGNPEKAECCAVIGGLDSQRAADCLCVVLGGDLLGNKVDSALGQILNACKKQKPAAYKCA